MDSFAYRDGRLFCEGVAVDDLLDRVGSPAYVYSKETFLRHYDALTSAFAELDPIICYSIKSCGNLNIVKLLAEQGSGMDVVSGGELFRAQQAGADMRQGRLRRRRQDRSGDRGGHPRGDRLVQHRVRGRVRERRRHRQAPG